MDEVGAGDIDPVPTSDGVPSEADERTLNVVREMIASLGEPDPPPMSQALRDQINNTSAENN